jgi:manganese efflux pump family protein
MTAWPVESPARPMLGSDADLVPEGGAEREPTCSEDNADAIGALYPMAGRLREDRVIALLTLGFTLSLDNFRIAVVLGGLKPTWGRSVKTSLIFALWDGVAPLVGIVVGQYLSARIDSTADLIAAAGLAAYGLFVVIRALVSPEDADPDMRWATRGLPLPLSIDNVAAGASLGLAGYSPWLAPVLFGVITFVMSVAGHQVGRAAAHFIPRIRTDLLTGLAFVAMALMVVMGTASA